MPSATFWGWTAGIIVLTAFVPYTRSIKAGKTKLARSTWLIWIVVSLLLLKSYDEVGGKDAIWLSWAYLAAVIWTATLSRKYGKGGWERLDRFCFAGTGVALSLWVASGSAAVGLFATLLVDAFGATGTVVKTWRHPEEEDSLTWCMTFTANLVNLLAVPSWDWLHGTYPIYMTAMTGTIAALSLRKFHKKSRSACGFRAKYPAK